VIRSRWNRFYLDQLGSKLLCRQIDIEFFNRLASMALTLAVTF